MCGDTVGLPATRPKGQADSGRLLETPLDAVQNTVREHVFVGDKEFVIARPERSDRLLDHPFVETQFSEDEYLPYWADLWPSARMLAKAILTETFSPGLEALEVGCGLGLPGIAALSRGLRVTFSDYDRTALRFVADNARINNFHNFTLLHMDWRCPPPGLRFPVILASDLVYELRNVEPLVNLIKQVLQPDGICLMTDQDRNPSQLLRESLGSAGLCYAAQLMRAGEPGERRVKGTLYRIKHRA
jgi:predicted nicotinamide N-methyase